MYKVVVRNGVFFLLQCNVFDYEQGFHSKKHCVEIVKYSEIGFFKIVFKI